MKREGPNRKYRRTQKGKQSSTKLGPYAIDNSIFYLEGLCQDLVRNGRLRGKESCGNNYGPGEVTVESGEGKGFSFSDISLEVDEPSGDDKHLPGGQNLGVENIVGRHEPHEELPFDDNAGLTRTGVRVGRVHPSGGEVNAVHRDPQSVDSREGKDIRRVHTNPEDVARVPFFAQPVIEKIFRGCVCDGFAGEAVDRRYSSS